MIWILPRSDSDRTSAPAEPREVAAVGGDGERQIEAVRAYITRMCGPGAAEVLTARAQAELAAEPSAGTPSAEAVTRIARRTAFAALEDGARRPRRRAERLLALHRHCARTPGLLREKAESEVSKPGIDGLYHHLDHCDYCASMAGRCDLAEWHLELELTAHEPASGNGATAPRRPLDAAPPSGRAPPAPPTPVAARATPVAPRPSPTPSRPPSRASAPGPDRAAPPAAPPAAGASAGDPLPPRAGVPAAGALALWGQGAGGGETPSAAMARGTPPDGSERRGLRAGDRRIAGAVAVLVAVAVAFTVVVLLGGGSRGSRRTPAPIAAGAPAQAPAQAPAPAPAAVLGVGPVPAAPIASRHGLRDPFVIGGLRLAVFHNPFQSWTSFERAAAGPGLRWEAVTVRVRNLSMTGFDPRVLDYRLLDGKGRSYAPVASAGTGPALGRPPRPLGAGQLVETRLGFRVDRAAAGLELRFSLAAGGPTVIVRLGG